MAEFSEEDFQRLQGRLYRREAELRAELKDLHDEDAGQPSSVTGNYVEDSGEQGEERMRSAVRYAEQERDIEELRDIEEARERIHQGLYGDCVDCGQPIGLQRLFAQPAAKRCVACQETFERRHPPRPHYPASV